MTIKNWSIKRSGASMTVYGINDATGTTIKVTHIVEAGWSEKHGQFVAQRSDGTVIELV